MPKWVTGKKVGTAGQRRTLDKVCKDFEWPESKPNDASFATSDGDCKNVDDEVNAQDSSRTSTDHPFNVDTESIGRKASWAHHRRRKRKAGLMVNSKHCSQPNGKKADMSLLAENPLASSTLLKEDTSLGEKHPQKLPPDCNSNQGNPNITGALQKPTQASVPSLLSNAPQKSAPASDDNLKHLPEISRKITDLQSVLFSWLTNKGHEVSRTFMENMEQQQQSMLQKQQDILSKLEGVSKEEELKNSEDKRVLQTRIDILEAELTTSNDSLKDMRKQMSLLKEKHTSCAADQMEPVGQNFQSQLNELHSQLLKERHERDQERKEHSQRLFEALEENKKLQYSHDQLQRKYEATQPIREENERLRSLIRQNFSSDVQFKPRPGRKDTRRAKRQKSISPSDDVPSPQQINSIHDFPPDAPEKLPDTRQDSGDLAHQCEDSPSTTKRLLQKHQPDNVAKKPVQRSRNYPSGRFAAKTSFRDLIPNYSMDSLAGSSATP